MQEARSIEVLFSPEILRKCKSWVQQTPSTSAIANPSDAPTIAPKTLPQTSIQNLVNKDEISKAEV